ncbi:MAG TPA: hypothetical protein PLU22_09080 [Polyangiaceae bacterium]|nr:hypothetical protein [Polyangiaceae bacterium]
MATRRMHWALVCAGILALPMVVTACHGGQSGPKVASIKPGEMPIGGEWEGVYYDQLYGNLHLKVDGDAAIGRWRRDSGESWGELNGTVDGDLMHYEWVEHRIGMVGPSSDTHGKGYFVYRDSPVEKDPDYIEGERGLNEDELGQKWKAIKQANVVPDLDSVMPDEVEQRGVGGGWDDSGEEGAPAEASGKDSGDQGKSGSGGKSKSGDDGDTDY